MDVKTALTKKIGPLPVWVIGLMILGGAWYIRSRNVANAVEGTDDTQTVEDAAAVGDSFPAFAQSPPPSGETGGTLPACPAGYYRDQNGDCVALPPTIQEKCPTGYYRDSHGDCVPLEPLPPEAPPSDTPEPTPTTPEPRTAVALPAGYGTSLRDKLRAAVKPKPKPPKKAKPKQHKKKKKAKH